MINQKPKFQVKRLTEFGQNITFYEVFVFDQFQDIFQPLIQQNNAPQSICGYTCIALTILIKNHLQHNKNFNEILENISAVQNVYQQIDSAMKYINNDRRNYIFINQEKFIESKDLNSYLRDWVANYEISDYFRNYEDNKNIWFFRNVSYDHPNEMLKLKHEEAQRVTEELPYKGQGYFFETYSPNPQFLNIQQFQQKWTSMDKNKQVFAIDLLGHFAVVLPQFNSNNEIKLYLIDTTNANYLQNPSFNTLANILICS